MTTSYKASLDSAHRIFALLVVTLTNQSVRKTAESQLLTLIKTAKASNATELGDVVRNAIVDMADETYANGITISSIPSFWRDAFTRCRKARRMSRFRVGAARIARRGAVAVVLACWG